MTEPIKDKAWIDNATLYEMMDAIRDEPIDSPLFGVELAPYFWAAYKAKYSELYMRPRNEKDQGT